MKRNSIRAAVLVIATALATTWFWTNGEMSRAQDRPAALKMETIFSEQLPDIERVANVVKLDLPPGSSSPAHAHPAHVFVYVTKGRITSSLGNGEKITYKAGQIWYETPNITHATFMNPSSTEPAQAIAFFIIEKDTPPTTLPVANPSRE